VPSQNALVVLAEFGDGGLIAPGLAGAVLRPTDARRLGLAMLRDCVEKAHHCAGFDPIVAYFPPHRRGEAAEAAGVRDVWAEPMAGPSRGTRAAGFMRHLIEERTYRTAVVLFPHFPHLERKFLFAAAQALRSPRVVAFGASPEGGLGFLGVCEAVPPTLGEALDGTDAPARIAAAAQGAGLSARSTVIPEPLSTESALAQAVFDLRASIATGTLAGDDLPLHTLETFDGLGLVATLSARGAVELQRAGPPGPPRS